MIAAIEISDEKLSFKLIQIGMKKPNTHIVVLDCKPEQPCFKNLMLKAATTGIGFQGKKLFVYIEAIWTIPKVYYFSTPY